MKRIISLNIRWLSIIFIILGLGFLFILYSKFTQDKSISIRQIVFEVSLTLICLLLSLIFYNTKTVEFDNDFMFVTSKTIQERIPLKRIFMVKLTIIGFYIWDFWKIKYYLQDRKSKSVRVLPKYKSQEFIEFKNLVGLANKDAKIKNWTHIFDFDI